MSTNKELAKACVEHVIQVFQGRAGFDGFWDDVDTDIQEDIKSECIEQCTHAVDAHESEKQAR